MEYLTIEEKASLTGYFVLIDEHIKKCRFMLESFYSVKEWQIPYLTQAEGFLLDSGAFTFMQAGKTGKL